MKPTPLLLFLILFGSASSGFAFDLFSLFRRGPRSVDLHPATKKAAVRAPRQYCSDKPVPNGVSKTKVLVVGWDGARWDTVVKAELAPEVQTLLKEGTVGTSFIYYQPLAFPEKIPGWSTVMTGVWPDKHGATEDLHEGNFTTYIPFLTRLELEKPELSTASFFSWQPFLFAGLANAVDSCFFSGYNPVVADAEITQQAAKVLTKENPDVVFAHYGSIGQAGEANIEPYYEAVRKTSAYLGVLLEAIKSRPTYSEEEWTVILTTDRGERDAGTTMEGTHQSRQVFVLAAGPGIEAGLKAFDIEIVDVASTVFRQLGIAVDPSWDLDGKPIQERSDEAMDSLLWKLHGNPSHGWTHQVPDEWYVMKNASGTDTYSRWVFVTKSYWTYQRYVGIGRENNLRARAVFAVADAAAYMPTTHVLATILRTSQFHITPSRSEAHVSFLCHYAPGREDEVRVGVTFDTSEDDVPIWVMELAREYVSEVVTIKVAVPQGAKNFYVSFFYAAKYTQGKYWAIDDVRVH